MIIKKSFLPIFLMAFSFHLTAQSGDTPLITFKDGVVTTNEFKQLYLKNNSGDLVEKSTVDEYLQLFINFKLKVKEAMELGMDTTVAFKKELSGYRAQLAQPYLSADQVMEDLKKEAYERMKSEIKASHILIASSPNDSPEDTLKAYKKAKKVLALLKDGSDFERTALEYSDDPSVKDNKGDLGYFTVFQMVYPFEIAAYNTPVGKVSDIVKSSYGYHILKVYDKRPAQGTVTVAHILVSNNSDISKTEDAENRIHEIYNRLKKGEDFATLAQQFSDDKNSARDGGQLKAFGVGQMVPEFEQEAFALKSPGDYSKPFKTRYGWHIVKLFNKEEIPTYADAEKPIEAKVRKDSRAKLTEGAVLKKIRNQYGFKENLKRRNDFYALIDSSYFAGKWDEKKVSRLNNVMFSISDKEYTQQGFAKYLKTNQSSHRRPIAAKALVNNMYKNYVERELLAYKDQHLEAEQPEFKALMKEYHDGILLFNLTDNLVWTKAVEDTTGLETFYTKHKNDYRWGKRLDAVIYSALNESLAKQAKALIKEGKDAKEITEELNQKSQLNLKYESKKYEKDDRPVLDKIDWKKGISKNIDENGRVSFVDVEAVLEPTYKTLDDARGMITSDYQNYLEKQWVEDLRKKYKYKINETALKSLKKELN